MIVALAAFTFAQAAPLPASAPPPANSVTCASGPFFADIACRAIAHQKDGRFAEAAASFEQAAAAVPALGPQASRALAAAGNMWIAAGEPGKAALSLDRALAGTGLQAEQRGLALIDRARAAEAQNDLKGARRFVTEAMKSASDDSFAWYFSAALAIREGDLATARQAINRALTLAPGDPDILFEAGHVAEAEGNSAAARDYWQRAVAAGPDSPSGQAAQRALAMAGPAAPGTPASVTPPPAKE